MCRATRLGKMRHGACEVAGKIDFTVQECSRGLAGKLAEVTDEVGLVAVSGVKSCIRPVWPGHVCRVKHLLEALHPAK